MVAFLFTSFFCGCLLLSGVMGCLLLDDFTSQVVNSSPENSCLEKEPKLTNLFKVGFPPVNLHVVKASCPPHSLHLSSSGHCKGGPWLQQYIFHGA